MIAVFFITSPAASVIQGYSSGNFISHASLQVPETSSSAVVSGILNEGPLLIHNSKLQNNANSSLLNASSLSVNYGGGYLGKYGNIYDVWGRKFLKQQKRARMCP